MQGSPVGHMVAVVLVNRRRVLREPRTVTPDLHRGGGHVFEQAAVDGVPVRAATYVHRDCAQVGERAPVEGDGGGPRELPGRGGGGNAYTGEQIGK